MKKFLTILVMLIVLVSVASCDDNYDYDVEDSLNTPSDTSDNVLNEDILVEDILKEDVIVEDQKEDINDIFAGLEIDADVLYIGQLSVQYDVEYVFKAYAGEHLLYTYPVVTIKAGENIKRVDISALLSMTKGHAQCLFSQGIYEESEVSFFIETNNDTTKYINVVSEKFIILEKPDNRVDLNQFYIGCSFSMNIDGLKDVLSINEKENDFDIQYSLKFFSEKDEELYEYIGGVVDGASLASTFVTLKNIFVKEGIKVSYFRVCTNMPEDKFINSISNKFAF